MKWKSQNQVKETGEELTGEGPKLSVFFFRHVSETKKTPTGWIGDGNTQESEEEKEAGD